MPHPLTSVQTHLPLLRSVGGISVANFLATACTIAINLMVVRVLPHVEYGRMATFLGAALLISLFLGFGLTTKVAGDLAAAADDVAETQRITGTLLLVRLATFVPTLAVGVAGMLVTGEVLFLLAACIAMFQNLTDFCVGIQQGLRQLRWVAAGLAAPALLQLAGLALFRPDTAEGVLLLQSLAFLAGAALIVIPAHAAFGGLRALAVSWDYVRGAVTSAGLIYVAVLLQMAFGVVVVSGLGAIGQFEASADLFFGLSLTRIPLLGLAPLVVSMYYPLVCANAHRPDYRVTLHGSFDLCARACLGATAAIVGFLVLWPESVIAVLGPQYLHTAPLVRLLSLLAITQVCDMLITNTLWGIGEIVVALKLVAARLAALGLLLLAGALLPWPDKSMLDVAAWSMVLSAVGTLAAQMWVVYRRTGWRLPVARPALGLAGAGVIVVIGRWAIGSSGLDLGGPVFISLAGTLGLASLATSLAVAGIRPRPVVQ